MNRSVLSVVLLSILSGCSLLTPKPADIVINEKPVPVICSATTNRPDALNLKDTPPTLVMDSREVWGYWFSPDLYASIAENLQAMRRYQQQQRIINRTIIDCIDSHNAAQAAK